MIYAFALTSLAILAQLVSCFVAPTRKIAFSNRPSTPHLLYSTEEKGVNEPVDIGISPRQFQASDIDDTNTPPSLSKIFDYLRCLKSGSDIRGQFFDHRRIGSFINVIHALDSRPDGCPPPLTPLAAHCLGSSFASMVKERFPMKEEVVVCIGRDPRPHGVRLSDAFARGVESVDGARALYNNLSTTPSMFEFCRVGKCDGGAMITASHLPEDRNGIKFFTSAGGFDKADIDDLISGAMTEARGWHDFGVLPASSGKEGVQCSEWVDFMPDYKDSLRNAIIREVKGDATGDRPLEGLRIVVNAGNGAGYFFGDILNDLGADVSHSILLQPDGTFPSGVPNPEDRKMIKETTMKCEECNADLGILFDTDADRSGFILPRTVDGGNNADYEPLNRNRLIALLSTIFAKSSPGSTIVTDSVTSEGLSKFLVNDLDLIHVRFLKGYANVIGKAREILENGTGQAEMAIETSGHCAMRENGWMDDGTYTAVKVVGLLARTVKEGGNSLLDSISGLEEMPVEDEIRMEVVDGSLDSTGLIFDQLAEAIARRANEKGGEEGWELDEENLEGVRVRTGGGAFFMLRKSLHDPLISLQVEGKSHDEVKSNVILPVLAIIEKHPSILDGLDVEPLRQ